MNMSIEIKFEEESDLNDPTPDTVFDLTDCCRTCLQHECSLTPTNSSDSDSIKFCDKLSACVSGMTWPREGMPSFICGICIEKLRIAYDFQTLCLQSDRAFELKVETNETQRCRSATPDPTTSGLVGCDETLGKVILNIKCEEKQVQPLSQCAADTSAPVQFEVKQTVDNPRKSGCQLCGKELCEHIQRHIGEKRLQCSVCYAEFTTTIGLIVHMRIHTGEKWYACNFCEKSCINESELLVHMRSHTGEKPFACSCCDKKFATKCLLNSHLKSHTGNKLFECHMCDKSYTGSYNLSAHIRTHTGEKSTCKLCGKQFAYASSLIMHMRSHTGEKFSCKLCDKRFTDPSSLNRHVRCHTGEKLSCKLCDKKFIWPTSLNYHVKTHLKDLQLFESP